MEIERREREREEVLETLEEGDLFKSKGESEGKNADEMEDFAFTGPCRQCLLSKRTGKKTRSVGPTISDITDHSFLTNGQVFLFFFLLPLFPFLVGYFGQISL